MQKQNPAPVLPLTFNVCPEAKLERDYAPESSINVSDKDPSGCQGEAQPKGYTLPSSRKKIIAENLKEERACYIIARCQDTLSTILLNRLNLRRRGFVPAPLYRPKVLHC